MLNEDLTRSLTGRISNDIIPYYTDSSDLRLSTQPDGLVMAGSLIFLDTFSHRPKFLRPHSEDVLYVFTKQKLNQSYLMATVNQLVRKPRARKLRKATPRWKHARKTWRNVLVYILPS